jgi:hypothetical protein
MVLIEEVAEPSFAARREASRLGIAMAAMIPIMATTISNSINEKPFICFLFIFLGPEKVWGMKLPPSPARLVGCFGAY